MGFWPVKSAQVSKHRSTKMSPRKAVTNPEKNTPELLMDPPFAPSSLDGLSLGATS
jgi:hypothetical protein